MTDTEEAYERAVRSIEDVYAEECGCERCIEHKQRGSAIRAHVAALEGEVNRLGHVSIEQENELAAVKAERDAWWRMYEGAEYRATQSWNKIKQLRSRIESAPKVWLWWHRNVEGKWHLWRVSDRADVWQGCTMTDDDRIDCGRFVVPVEALFFDASKKEDHGKD